MVTVLVPARKWSFETVPEVVYETNVVTADLIYEFLAETAKQMAFDAPMVDALLETL